MTPPAFRDADGTWRVPPAALALPADAVHLWRASLDVEPPVLERCAAWLAAEEMARAGRFHFERDRRHFIIGRGFLRNVLGRYLNVDPVTLRFIYSEFGKPALAASDHPSELSFNLSHAAGLALLGVTRERAIGVDVEKIRPEFPSREIADHFFSPKEVTVLETIPPAQVPEAFFNCWTRKEAYIKARGAGLSIPLDSFDVTLRPGEEARLLADRRDPMAATRWSLQAIDPGRGYIGAVAVAHSGCRVTHWQWTSRDFP